MAQTAYKTQPAAENPYMTVVIPAEGKITEPKYKKDGTLKKTVCNKKAGEKSEVYPFEEEDIKKILTWFLDREMWIHYLILTLSSNLARRISDVLELKWSDIFNSKTGNFRSGMEIKEKKTGKLADRHLNSVCRDAVIFYLEKTGCDVTANNFENDVFLQLSGTYKGRKISYNGYLKQLKRAAEENGIEYNVGTHSARKTYGMISYKTHPGDVYRDDVLQTDFNHSDVKTTRRYIGLTKERVDKYHDDFGDYWNDYILGDKTFKDVAENPVVSLDVNDLREVIARAYRAGGENAGNPDGNVHIEAVNSIMAMIEGLAK